jgi:hypothetical protein
MIKPVARLLARLLVGLSMVTALVVMAAPQVEASGVHPDYDTNWPCTGC